MTLVQYRWPEAVRLLFILAITTSFMIRPYHANQFNTRQDSELDQRHHHHHNADNGNIPVNIQVQPAHYLHGKNYVPTKMNIIATAEILDEKFKNLPLTYQWSAKNATITTDQKASQIVYKFDKADNDNFLKVLVYHRPNDTGTSQKDFVVRDPINVADPIGKFFLEHGELLNITLKFTGTGPFSYCRKFCFDDTHDEAGQECKDCDPDGWTEANQIKILSYLRRVGNYSLVFVVDNIASRQVKIYSVRIFDTVRHQSIPLEPIVSSISAVFILLAGVAFHLKFKDSAFTETADFDFARNNYEEEWDDEQLFAQRVKDMFFRSNIGNNDDRGSFMDPNLSGSRTRLT